METPTTANQIADKSSSSHNTVDISEIVNSWIVAFESGQLGPWVKRLTSDGRLDSFKYLIHKHGIRYAGCTLDNFEITRPDVQQPIIDRLREFAKEMPERMRAGSGLVLIGTVGTGKDHLQFALMRTAIIEHGFSVEWHDGLQLQDSVRHAIHEQKEHLLRMDLADPQILAISDPIPPVGNPSDWNVSFLRDVIDRRYREGKSTWITSNVLALADLKPALSIPLVDRLGHECVVEVLQWPSYRKPAKRIGFGN